MEFSAQHLARAMENVGGDGREAFLTRSSKS